MRDLEDGDTGRRRFASGQFVPFDGMFTDIWGGGLPLLQGELFPLHTDMGESKWTYAGPRIARTSAACRVESDETGEEKLGPYRPSERQ